MYQYINGFSCSSSEDGSTVILQFRQKMPDINDDGEFQGLRVERVASILMDMDVALELGRALCDAKDGFEPEDSKRDDGKQE